MTGLLLGVGVSNMLIYRFLWGREWFDAIGIGCTAGVIAAFLYWIIQGLR
jgi:hypothetical protein